MSKDAEILHVVFNNALAVKIIESFLLQTVLRPVAKSIKFIDSVICKVGLHLFFGDEFNFLHCFPLLLKSRRTSLRSFTLTGCTSLLFGSHSLGLAVHEGFQSPILTASSIQNSAAATWLQV